MLELGDFSLSMPQFDVMAIHELLGLTFCCLVIGCQNSKRSMMRPAAPMM